MFTCLLQQLGCNRLVQSGFSGSNCRFFSLSRVQYRLHKSYKPWTTSELEQLKTLRAQGLSIAELAHALDRSQSSIQNHLHEKAHRPPSGRARWWSKDEDERLLALDRAGRNAHLIWKAFPDRTYFAVRNRRIKLKAEHAFAPVQHMHVYGVSLPAAWTEEDDRRLIELYDRGLTWKAIGEHFPGRTAYALQYRISRVRSGPARMVQIPWSKDEDERLLQLKQQGLTYAVISSKLQRSLGSIEGRFKRLNDTEEWSRTGNPRWTDDEKSILLEMKARGASWPEIGAAIPRRGPNAARSYWARIFRGRTNLMPLCSMTCGAAEMCELDNKSNVPSQLSI